MPKAAIRNTLGGIFLGGPHVTKMHYSNQLYGYS